MKVAAVYRFKNGMVMTFDDNGKQIPELQGKYTIELLSKIVEYSDINTKLFGMDGHPVQWNKPAAG